jgi:hypothetical protein
VASHESLPAEQARWKSLPEPDDGFGLDGLLIRTTAVNHLHWRFPWKKRRPCQSSYSFVCTNFLPSIPSLLFLGPVVSTVSSGKTAISCSVRFPASSKQRRSTADQRWGIHCVQLGVWYTSISTLRRLIKDSTTRYSREITQQAPSEAYISLANLLRISKLWLSIIVTYNNHSKYSRGYPYKRPILGRDEFSPKTTSGHGIRKQQSRARDYNRRNTPNHFSTSVGKKECQAAAWRPL